MKEFMLKRERMERKGFFLTGVPLLLIFLLAMPVSGAGELTANREFSETSVNPGDTFRVTVLITANQGVVAPALDEDLPENWLLTSVDKAGATFKKSTAEWIWVAELAQGESKTVIYDVTVPVDASEGSYFIKGNVSAFEVENIPVEGDSEISVGPGKAPLSASRDISDQEVAPGESFTVSVNVTALEELTAPSLDEDLPEGWNLSQVEDAGAVFKPSTFEWVWVESFAAGESREVIYEVEVPVSASEGTYPISGSVSAFNVSSSSVQGEKEVSVSEDGGEPSEEGILLYSGWNFISVPYALKNASVEQVLEGINYTSLIYYNAGSGSWEEPENFEPLKAYWLLANSNETQNIALDKLEKKPISGAELPTSLKVYEGWNSVGYTDSEDVLSAELSLKSIDGIYTSVLGPWDPVKETYTYSGHNGESGVISGKHVGTDVFEMKAYEGYWVYATGNGSLAAVWG